MKELRRIDMEFIQELRREGNGMIANRLIEAFRKDVKKSGKDTIKDISKHDRMKRKTMGLCTNLWCKRKTKKYLCNECYKIKMKWQLKKCNDCKDCGIAIGRTSERCSKCAKKRYWELKHAISQEQ